MNQNEKITVIIPTLCKAMEIMSHTLEELDKNEHVESIMVFDNTLGDFNINLKKIQIFNTENLYVNPAWNYGVNLTTTPYYLLLNDDVIVQSNVIDSCIKLMEENKSIGLCTVATKDILPEEANFYLKIHDVDDEPDFQIMSGQLGWFMFGRRELYKPIHPDLKLFYGDDYIYKFTRDQKKKCAVINNYLIYHQVSTTCKATKKYEDGTLEKEQEIYKKFIEGNKNNKTVSLCMIVKNEEANLDRCLLSAKNLVDEIIIVDTGSTDKTKEIAAKYTDKIYNYKWNDNFAEARNESIKYATKDWVLILDADEEVISNKEELQQILNIEMTKLISYQIRIINIIENGVVEHFMGRLFPNHVGIKYEGMIHEYLAKEDMISVCTENFRINHYGYNSDVPNGEEKLKRNIDLLDSAVKTEQDKCLYYFHSAITFASSSRKKEAYNMFDKWFKESLKVKSELSMGFSAYLSLLIEDKEYQKALDLVKPYIYQCKHNPNFACNLGIIYKELKMKDKAIDMLKQAMKATSLSSTVVDKGAFTWKPRAIIGNIYVEEGELDEAAKYWEEAYEFEQSVEIIENLAGLFFNMRDIDKTLFYLEKLFEKDPKKKSGENLVMYANLLFNIGKIEESIQYFLQSKDADKYIETLISGCISMKKFDIVERIQNCTKKAS